MTLAFSSASPEIARWTRLHGAAIGKAAFKIKPEDFIVQENLGFEPTGEGEHHFLHVQKRNVNTAYAAEVFARFSGIPLRDISYAGRKDKYALTEQYFTVYQGKHAAPDWNSFSHPDINLLSATRHNKKLKTGALQGNTFIIKLHEFAPIDSENAGNIEKAVANRINTIAKEGVPNYYGQQRFGEMHTANGTVYNGNLHLGMRMAEGEVIKNRNKRSMAISALRSFLFNEIVSNRVSQQLHETILSGDALQLAGSNSFFICDANKQAKGQNEEELNERLRQRDIFITASLAGKGKALVEEEALKFEQACLNDHENILRTLVSAGLKQERRPIMLYPADLGWTLKENELELRFSLTSGAFATSVLRELCEFY
uniref:tRNA pseudouridine(13) synthase TruD n=1 Tax=Ningiella ruwaisensis TaxID=2364274 RepID=UPI00109F0121|nr:tRNA pseudouridine(13) synthase TruD [Ningiella ruwaisensis]